MSKARDAIAEVLEIEGLLPGRVEQIADALMPIVRETVARAAENAANALADMDDEPHAARWLRIWAKDARSE